MAYKVSRVKNKDNGSEDRMAQKKAKMSHPGRGKQPKGSSKPTAKNKVRNAKAQKIDSNLDMMF